MSDVFCFTFCGKEVTVLLDNVLAISEDAESDFGVCAIFLKGNENPFHCGEDYAIVKKRYIDALNGSIVKECKGCAYYEL